MGAVGHWISSAWKETGGKLTEAIGINRAWDKVGGKDIWENSVDALFGNNDTGYDQTLNSDDEDASITGVVTPDTEKQNEDESDVESEENVGGEGAEGVARQVKATTAKGSLIGTGIPTFGFTQSEDKPGNNTKKLGA